MAVVHPNAQAHRPTVDHARLVRLGGELLEALGLDVDNPGITDTPKRWANWWREFIEYDAGNTETVFDTQTSGQLVAVTGMRVWSICEHHLLPFWCDVSIGYMPNQHVLGLSKFARIAHQFAHKPQLQERLISEIATEVERVTKTNDVIVVGRGLHLCMVMRGIQTTGLMTSLVSNGRFNHDTVLRAEFMRLAVTPN